MKKRVIALLCLLVMAVSLVATGCQEKAVAFKRGTPVAVNKFNYRGLEEDEFFLGGYIGPQSYYAAVGYSLPSLITDETYEKLAQAGITHVIEQRFGVDSEDGKLAMELAGKHGISYIIGARDLLKLDITNTDDAIIGSVEEVAAKMEELMDNPGFAGFYLRDEPPSYLFPYLTQAIETIYEAREQVGDTTINGFINAFPGVGAAQLSGNTDSTMNWEKYLQGICDTGIDFLSFDAYPFTNVPGEVQATWLNALGTMNRVSDENNLPWMGNIQCGGYLPFFSTSHRVVNEGEMNWNVGTMLAFGAKGLIYYTLVTPPEGALQGEEYVNNDSILNKYGSKTPFYYYAEKINAQIKAIDHVLLNAAHEGVILDNENSPNRYDGDDLLSSYRCLTGVSGDSSLIGCFDYEGTVALLVMNNSLDEHHAKVTLKFDNNYEYEVIQRAVSATTSGKEFTLHLEAGEFALVVVQ